MKSWEHQAGVPVLNVNRNYESGSVQFTQVNLQVVMQITGIFISFCFRSDFFLIVKTVIIKPIGTYQ